MRSCLLTPQSTSAVEQEGGLGVTRGLWPGHEAGPTCLRLASTDTSPVRSAPCKVQGKWGSGCQLMTEALVIASFPAGTSKTFPAFQVSTEAPPNQRTCSGKIIWMRRGRSCR